MTGHVIDGRSQEGKQVGHNVVDQGNEEGRIFAGYVDQRFESGVDGMTTQSRELLK